MNKRTIHFSVFKNRYDTHANPVARDWDYWVNELSKPQITQNKDTFAIVLGHIAAGRTHANNEVEHIDALGLDLDGLTDNTIAQIYDKLQGLEFLMYTSYNHSDTVNKLRVILPLSEPLQAADFPRAWSKLNRYIGGYNDPQTSNIARLFYVHSHPQERAQFAQVIHNEGEWLDINALTVNNDATSQEEPEPVVANNNPTRFLLTRDMILEEGRRRARWRGSRDRLVGQLLKALGRGDSFAEKGSRENARFLLCQTLLEIWPELDLEHATELFRPSIAAMHADKPLKTGVEGTLKEIKYKLGRARVKVQAEREQFANRVRDEQARINYDARGDGLDTEYTEQDLATIASMQDCSVHELKNRWIAYKDGCAYFLNMRGYQGPFGKADVRSLAAIFLNPINGVTAYNPPARRGANRMIKSYAELTSEYGSVIHDIEASLIHDYSTFDKVTGKLVEITAPKSPFIKPVQHEHVQRWLQLLGGDQAGKLVDWVAAVPHLHRQCCALYLWGSKGVGKTLLLNGLARLWNLSDPTPLDAVIDAFNERLARMPLIVADEYLPDAKNMSGKLREFIASQSHTLRRKYRPEASLTGCIRLVILANTPHLLDLKGDHTKEDLDAIAERFLFIQTQKEASGYLESLPQETKDMMLKKHIAEHCLWLSENWDIQEGRRFIVEGHLGEANLNISINNERTAMICEWLIEYLTNPESLENNPRLSGLVRIEDQSLWVNSYAIQKAWSLYMDKANGMSARAIGIALKAVASKEEDNYKRERVNGNQRGFYKINTDLLSSWSEAHGRMSHEDISNIVGCAPF